MKNSKQVKKATKKAFKRLMEMPKEELSALLAEREKEGFPIGRMLSDAGIIGENTSPEEDLQGDYVKYLLITSMLNSYGFPKEYCVSEHKDEKSLKDAIHKHRHYFLDSNKDMEVYIINKKLNISIQNDPEKLVALNNMEKL